MEQKRRHVLNVYSQQISLFSEDAEEYMQGLASFVDGRMHDFAKGVSRISFGDLCILTALSIADDFFKMKQEFSKFHEDKARLEEELAEALSKVMGLEASVREREFKIDKMNETLENLDNSLHLNNESKEIFIKKLNVLSYELRKPLEERSFEAELKDAYRILEEADLEKQNES